MDHVNVLCRGRPRKLMEADLVEADLRVGLSEALPDVTMFR
jgi:hypothetical protein